MKQFIINYWRLVRLLAAGMLVVVMATADPLNDRAEAVSLPPAVQHSLLLSGSGHVAIPHNAALNPTTAFTVEAWVRRNNDSRCETIVAKGFETAYWLGFCNTRIRFYASGPGSWEDGNTAVPANLWTHIAVVYKGSGREYYINGELDYQGGPEPTPTTNALPVYIGADPGSFGLYPFDGRISNVRLWNVARSQEQIRRWMHVAVDEPLPGLLANWRLAGDYGDNVGGFHGTPQGTTSFNNLNPPPAQPLTVTLDRGFNELPLRRHGHAVAYLPEADQALLIGGFRSGAISTAVDLLDATTGNVTAGIGALPQALTHLAAVYVPAITPAPAGQGTVYTFGGSTDTSWSAPGTDKIFAIDPVTGNTRTVAAVLPQGANAPAAVYHPVHHKVYIFGGRSSSGTLTTISIFDPETETISTPAGFTLPEGRSHMGGVYAGINGRIYLFGGFHPSSGSGNVRDNVYEVELAAGGLSGTVTLLSDSRLPVAGAIVNAVEDPRTKLIYVMGGYAQDWVLAFDPATKALWQTRVALPRQRYGSGAIYSLPNRHALLIGGDEFNIERNVWRIPLGDGPLVPTGHWAFPPPVPSGVTAVDGDGSRVAVGTESHGVYLYQSSGSRAHYSAAALGGSGRINDLVYNDRHNHTWVATHNAGGKRIDNGVIFNYGSDVLGTNQILSVATMPGYSSATGEGAPLFGTAGQGLRWRRFIFDPGGGPGYYAWQTNFSGASISAVAPRTASDIYVVAASDLRRVQATLLGTTETNYGQRCGLLLPSGLAFGPNWDWWLVSPGTFEFGGEGICRIPAAATPGSGAWLGSLLGNQAHDIDGDSDGRLWLAVQSDPGYTSDSGGLAVFEVGRSGVRNEEFNWLNAPLGSRTPVILGSSRAWDSRVTAVGAAEERVWSGNGNGRLVTLAQRWQQIADANDVGTRAIQKVWTVRGRLFAATSSTLHVLQPDGATWDNRSSGKVWDVLGDSQGNIWVATNTGIRLYTAGGWDYLTDREGVRPATATYALTEDHNGRIWIGGLHGLTLFDRNRFVATFTTANSGLPANAIRTLFVDSNNDLWAGTDVGLARFDGLGWTTYTTAQGLPHNTIFDLDQPGTGHLAISTANGLSLYNGVSFTTQSLPIAAANLPLSVDENGRLWAGRAVRQGAQWRVYYSTNSGLRHDSVSDTATDGADRIWFSHGALGGLSVRATYLPPLGNTIPVVGGITPNRGRAGDLLTINGSGFGNSATDVTVVIGRERAQVLSVTPTQIEVRLLATNSSGDVSVTVGERRTALAEAFCAIPTITGFTPTGGNDGVTVTVSGQNFDPGARVYLGSDNWRPAYVPRYDPAGTHLALDILPEDGIGLVRVANRCTGADFVATSTEQFRRITLNLEQMVLNQGLDSMGLVAGRPTLVQHYLSHSLAPRDTDRIQINLVELTITEGSNPPLLVSRRNEAQFPTFDGPPGAELLADVANSLNLVVSPFVGGDILPGNNVTVEAVLKNGSRTIATGGTAVHFRPDIPIRVLLVPIMRNDYSAADLNNLRSTTNGGLNDLRSRLFPTGRVDFFWSPQVFTINDVIITDESVVDIGDTLVLYDASHNLDGARRHWNQNRNPKMMVAFGVVDPVVNNGNAAGKAFWPDLSAAMNAAGLTALDQLCDVGAFVLNIFTLGLAGIDGCDLEIPLYVGWAESSGNSSELIGHELGHIFGLVRAPAPNADLFDNFTHSVNDEIDGGECGSLGNGGVYNANRTLYRQPGVREPVLNPLLPDPQIRPGWEITGTATFLNPTRTVTSEALHPRAKAIMSYACNRFNWNSFFEPADMIQIFFEFFSGGMRPSAPLMTTPVATAVYGGPTPIPQAGQRLYVSGLVNRADQTGELRYVTVLGDTAPLDLSYQTGYWLVQLNSSGSELARSGVFPVFGATDHAATAQDEVELDLAFFAATILAQSGVSTIELRHQDTVLDTFSAGTAAPVVSISSPSGGSYSGGTIPVSWSAADADGDALTITIFYSADDGATWMPVAFSTEAVGGHQVPVAALPGSANARMRVVASDGFQQGQAVSAAFSVTAQPPLPFIGAPLSGQEVLEGRPLHLSGGATDNEDLLVAGESLHWSSNRDGYLGAGELLERFLTVGTHVITLEAANSAGLWASTSVTVTVIGDYDYDGIPDAVELANGWNIFTSADAFSDNDGDGLILLVEWLRGLDPNNPDSDGDGRSDGQEVADGTDPATPDDPLPPDALALYPQSLALAADRSLDVAFPQAQLQVVSRRPATWSVSSNRSWLTTLRAEGVTPSGVTVLVQANLLSDGTHSGELTFSSELGSVIVPVSVTVTSGEIVGEGWLNFLPVIMR
jgi:hypothetical protein